MKKVRNTNRTDAEKARLKHRIIVCLSMGGACAVTGYNKSMSALECHHINDVTKESSISTASYDVLRKELAKCVQVCSNVHREIHAGVTPSPQRSSFNVALFDYLLTLSLEKIIAMAIMMGVDIDS